MKKDININDTKGTRKAAKKRRKQPEKKIYKVPEPEPIHRCCYCGGTDYVLPRAKSLIKAGCRYCADADCNGFMILYDYTATQELRSGITPLFHLQWSLAEDGLGVLGGSIKEVETNLFQKLNAATVAFGNFKGDGLFTREKETLQEHKDRVEKNRVRAIEKEIRKSIPKEWKEGKTRKEIQVLVEKIKMKIKMEKRQQRKKTIDSNVISMQEYRQRKARGKGVAMDQYKITPKQAKVLYQLLCNHDARTLDPDCSDYWQLDLMLDDLRFMLMKIRDGKGGYPGNRIVLKLRPGDPGRVPH